MEQEQPNLNLDDLKVMMQIIKVVSNRGAIQPEEMALVGNLYSKLAAFVKAASEKSQEPEEKTENQE